MCIRDRQMEELWEKARQEAAITTVAQSTAPTEEQQAEGQDLNGDGDDSELTNSQIEELWEKARQEAEATTVAPPEFTEHQGGGHSEGTGDESSQGELTESRMESLWEKARRESEATTVDGSEELEIDEAWEIEAERAWEEAQKRQAEIDALAEVDELDEGAVGDQMSWDISYEDLSFQYDSVHDQGAFGCIYKGKYCGTDVAIKQLSYPTDVDVRKYIDREMDVLRHMRHPNIVQLLGLAQHGKKFFLVTDFMKEGNLRQLLKESRRNVPWRNRTTMAQDIIRALIYMHSKGVMHRDIKSKNLLVDEGGTRLKLCDFGFARRFEDRFRRRMTICGTDSWMAPEVVLGKEYDWAADVYSCGIVFWEMLTRVSATKFSRDVDAGYSIVLTELKEMVPKDAPEKFVKLAIACTDNNPKNRPTLREILDILNKLELRLPIEHNVELVNILNSITKERKMNQMDVPIWRSGVPKSDEQIQRYKAYMIKKYQAEEHNNHLFLEEKIARERALAAVTNNPEFSASAKNILLKTLVEENGELRLQLEDLTRANAELEEKYARLCKRLEKNESKNIDTKAKDTEDS
eukprot:TRINITY_DN4926_c0_g2_i1.p1 TRINITY_DN4926_c0_g2~~TRINITY_DN4926_c0_g2_i1.p1  ORF type:complete len:578 (+),score=134.37 TRINITY_DN4926_c0_g2_i1:40-1773(+)